MMRPEILALIPARGGSKSIPRKNLLPLAGKPLIAHSIGHALASRHITRTIVSTDDDEIAEVARAFGAEVPFMRPGEFATDVSPDIDTFRHALRALHDRDGYQCDAVVHLRPTGPVRRVARIDEAIERFLAHPDADSLRSVSAAGQTPYKMWRMIDGLMEPIARLDGQESWCLPRQSLPQVYWQNGYVDIIRPGVIVDAGSMTGSRVLPLVIDEPIYELDYPDQIAAAAAAIEALLRGDAPAAPRPHRHAV
jgi:N-acylneuraminate cytidylyltransferase